MKRLRQWLARNRMRKATRLLARLDERMIAAHLPRAERRRFWNEVRAGRATVTDGLDDEGSA